MVDNIDIELIKLLQEDMPLVEKPYHEIADKIGISESEVFDRINSLINSGALKRIACALKHTKVGYDDNAMVVWDIDDKMASYCGTVMARHERVSHCYARVRDEELDYNIYTMIHAKSREECDEIIARLKHISKPRKYKVLTSVEELKKIGMKYFV